MRTITPIILIMLLAGINTYAGKKLRVLFLGNSYTYFNNMPQIVADIATSTGDTLIWEMEAPGGYYLNDHLSNPTSINKIKNSKWDYIILQEQSQAPALPTYQIGSVFKSARSLDSLIKIYNPCAETIFYMTWGRKNGDSLYYQVYKPWYREATYTYMDSLLRERYITMADSNHAVISPVGAVWRYIRNTYVYIDLYNADESHPSGEGSYAAACAFYTAIFRKDPTLISYNYTLNSIKAVSIRSAVEKIVYDSMAYWHIGQYGLMASMNYTAAGTNVTFNNTSTNAHTYKWSFGDGTQSVLKNPVHVYSYGSYKLQLIANDTIKGCSDTTYTTINVYPSGINSQEVNAIEIYPNPSSGVFTISSTIFQQAVFNIRIQNQLGQVISTNATDGNSIQHINLSKQPSGMYIISVMKDTQCIHRSKLLKG